MNSQKNGEPSWSFSTGLPSLDTALHSILPGDNIVWQVESIEEYLPFTHPFCNHAHSTGSTLVYFRFGQHHHLLPEGIDAHEYTLHPEKGFESFISEIFDIIEQIGKGAYYLFDSLSELAVDWYSDRMLGNFFMLTCPYLFDYETATYFALLKNHHTAQATNAIHNTAQVVLDVYRNQERLFVQPVKVENRHSPTMYTLHIWENNEFHPVTRSATITEILSGVPQPWLDFTVQRMGVWQRTFLQAQETLEMVRSGKLPGYEVEIFFTRIVRMAIARDEKLLYLAETFFDLDALLLIRKRMIGTGLIGGKSVGMLLARAILRRSNKKWNSLLEKHDSFYIGSDVFYTYLVRNNCWWPIRRLKKTNRLVEDCDTIFKKILDGEFPSYFQEQFKEMLDYFGQSPIIVRSSSLLEDAYGNAFSGKYESVFCTNRGTREERLQEFTKAVKTVYASTMSREALLYREQRGLLDREEQMALLVQRVSGDAYGKNFFPNIAGVGFSFNPYVWNEDIDPKAGMIRLVFGLGTRAVNRSDDDYTRIVALNAPSLRPEANRDEMRKYTQRKVDVLDLEHHCQETRYFHDIVKESPQLQLEIFATRDRELEGRYRSQNRPIPSCWLLTFQNLLANSSFIENMREMLSTLQSAYDYPVDVEFTANFLDDGSYRINVVQCRPFQVKKQSAATITQFNKEESDSVLVSHGPIIGTSKEMVIDRLIFVDHARYGKLSENERYMVAKNVGKLAQIDVKQGTGNLMLIGPGRWCTSMPSLGVPAIFSEINKASVLCELSAMHEGLVPDVSLGTHFFNDLVELDMLYVAVHPDKRKDRLDTKAILQFPNRYEDLLPEDAHWSHVIHVVDWLSDDAEHTLFLTADTVHQRATLYFR